MPWPERVVTLMTTLVLSPYSAGGAPAMTSMRLDRVQRNLVGEDFALLIGDGLAIHRKRVLRVVAQAVEQAIGIGRDPRRGQCDQRTHGRRCAFQRKLVEQVLVHVSMERGIVLQQVFAEASTVTVSDELFTSRLTLTFIGTSDRTSTS